MIDIGGISDWQEVKSTDVLTFAQPNPRPVTLMVNTTGATAVYVAPLGAREEGDLGYLVGLVTGLEKLKFEVPGPYEVFHAAPDGVRVFMRLGDGDVLHRENLDEETFTKLHIERTIDPNVQAVMNAMQMQHVRQMNDMKYSMEVEIARLRNERPANARTPDPQQADDGEAPAGPVEPVDPPVDNDGGS